MSTILNNKEIHHKESDMDLSKKIYDWDYILTVVKKHKKQLLLANLIAIVATLASIPVPLLMPLLVDEVLLNNPSIVVETINKLVILYYI